MIDDGLLNLFGRQVGQLAEPFLATTAQEVAIPFAIAPRGLGVDQASGAASAVAPIAEQSALQVVLQNPVTLPRTAAHVHHFLHPVEERLTNDRFVPAGVELTVVHNPPGVVRVLQHLAQPLERHRPLRQFAAGTSCQPKVRHRRFEPFQPVVTRGVQLKGSLHQRCSLRVLSD
ncbi:hypothetical protein [Nocardia sp. CC201C]|uniref:hypothetical protein n=1 Tax=Nocardia sp. CC201C TaxID=3044575 RepID=UPI0024A9966F|nr:hypothetical protein [Nocardia sp. CC201C]